MSGPLVGFNTNVRHRNRVFHIQTEDSGRKHPHVITHLFADGGRVIASRKTSYAEDLARDDANDFVKKLMQEQHKAMLVALRDGAYDKDIGAEAEGETATSQPTPHFSPLRPSAAQSGYAASLPARDKTLDEVVLSYLAEELDGQ